MTIRSRRKKPRPGRLDAEGMAALRREVFERDGYRCQQMHVVAIDWKLGKLYRKCNEIVTWEIGHLCHVRNRRMWGDTPENTFCGCPDCHRKYHERGPSLEKIVPSKHPLTT